MKNKFLTPLILAVITVIVLIGIYIFINKNTHTNTFDPRNAEFSLEGEPVKLVDGETDQVKYIGLDGQGDLNADGIDDYVFWINYNPGGSGTFYYTVAALSSNNTYSLTDALFVGDRISPKSTTIIDNTGTFEIEYLDRKSDEPMAATPTVLNKKTFRVVPE